MDSPASGIQRSQPRSCRKPLQPRNSLAEPLPRRDLKPKPAPKSPPIALFANVISADKENWLPAPASVVLVAGIGPLDTSLAEELGAVRRRRERLRSERERTEEVLAERGRLLDRALRDVERRWEEQRRVELELRRLIRLQQMGSPCGRPSPFQSLREREVEKRKKDAQSQLQKKEARQVVMKENVEAEPSGSKEEQGA